MYKKSFKRGKVGRRHGKRTFGSKRGSRRRKSLTSYTLSRGGIRL